MLYCDRKQVKRKSGSGSFFVLENETKVEAGPFLFSKMKLCSGFKTLLR